MTSDEFRNRLLEEWASDHNVRDVIETAVRLRSLNASFEIGDLVEKFTGDYQLTGTVRAVFTTSTGKVRYVVEHRPGFLHIYSETNLRKATALVEEVDVDGMVDEAKGVIYIGKATKQSNGKWRALANVGGAFCLVECTLTYQPSPASTAATSLTGNEFDRAEQFRAQKEAHTCTECESLPPHFMCWEDASGMIRWKGTEGA